MSDYIFDYNQAVKEAWKQGKQIEFAMKGLENWQDVETPGFLPHYQYRIKETKKGKLVPHQHRDLIIAWANGNEIEYKYGDGDDWRDTFNKPMWLDGVEYRVKQ